MIAAGQLSQARYISLETFRKNGNPVRTVVWLVEREGTLYVRTDPQSGKVKRIRKNQHVRVAKTDIRGRVSGNWMDGEAKLVDDKEAGGILELFRMKYGFQIRLLGALARFNRARRHPIVVAIQLGNPGTK